MDVQQILRWIIIAIVMMVAVVILSLVLQVAGFLLKIGLKVLLVLFIIAVILRFFALIKERR